MSFARGLNDTPKIAALLLVLKAFDISYGIMLVTVAIAVGGLIHSKRIAETMSHQIAEINHGQGLCSNLTAGLLVILASKFGLPVSTTHVTVGALFGIGLFTRQAKLSTMRNIALSWIVTLPCAAGVGALVYGAVR